MHIKLILLAGLFGITLAGCASTSYYKSPAVDPGNNLQINQSFQNLPNGSHVYFQNGVSMSSKQLDKWLPYCALYVYNNQHKADYVTSVKPGQFRISSIKNRREVVDSSPGLLSNRLQFASLGREEFEFPSFILYKFDMHLQSDQQPDVKSLTCFQKSSTYGDYYPDIDQIKQSLGQVIEIDSTGV